MNPPKTIKILSDQNELQFLETRKQPKGETMYVYRYVVSKNKLGMELPLSESDLEKLIKINNTGG